jgi:hypothetical protein
MELYCLRRDDGLYVQDMRKAKDDKSYTRYLDRAKMFKTIAEARKEICNVDEKIEKVSDILMGKMNYER